MVIIVVHQFRNPESMNHCQVKIKIILYDSNNNNNNNNNNS
jgi:hypothetical protein